MLLVSCLKVELLFALEGYLFVICDGRKFVELDNVVVKPVLYVCHHNNSFSHLAVLVSEHNSCKRFTRPSRIFKQESSRVVVEEQRWDYLVKLSEQLAPHKLCAHVSRKTLVKFFSEHHFWRQKNGLNSLLVSILLVPPLNIYNK